MNDAEQLLRLVAMLPSLSAEVRLSAIDDARRARREPSEWLAYLAANTLMKRLPEVVEVEAFLAAVPAPHDDSAVWETLLSSAN